MFPLYFDEDSAARSLMRALRSSGFDCLTAHEADRLRRTDEDQLAFATEQGRVLYSKNAGDFARLDKAWQLTGRSHAGIVLVSDQLTPIGVQLRALQSMSDTFEAEDMVNRLVFLANYI